MAGKFKIMGYDKGNDTYEQIEEARTKKEALLAAEKPAGTGFIIAIDHQFRRLVQITVYRIEQVPSPFRADVDI